MEGQSANNLRTIPQVVRQVGLLPSVAMFLHHREEPNTYAPTYRKFRDLLGETLNIAQDR